MHAHFDLRVLDFFSPQVSLPRHGCFQAIPNGPYVFNGVFELLITRINRVDASQLSRIIELRFLDKPLLALRTKFLATDDQALWLLESL